MTDKPSAWMPLYVGDYLGDTQRLSTEQHGAYLLLILDYWRNGPPPDDNAVLQQITKLDAASWKSHRPTLAKMFQVVGGEWQHKRINGELASAAANQERRTDKAKTAAQARWKNATSNAPSMPEAMLDECPPPSPATNVASKRGKTDGADAVPLPDSPLSRIMTAARMTEIPSDRQILAAWLAEGIDVEATICPVAARIAERENTRGKPIRKFKYLDDAVREEHGLVARERLRLAEISQNYAGAA